MGRDSTISGAARLRRALSLALAATALALAAGCGGGGQSTGAADSGDGAGIPEFGANVVRVPGLSSTDVAGAAEMVAYPPKQGKVPNGFVLFPRADWRRAVLGAQFVSSPVDAALLPTELQYLPQAASDLVSRLRPPGFPSGPKLQALLFGEPGDEVVLAFEQQHENLTKLSEPDPTKLSSQLVAYRGGWAGKFSDEILLVSDADADRGYALAAGAWSGFTGDTVAFVHPDSIPAATRELLAQRRKLRLIKPHIWIVGPPSAVSDSVASELRSFGDVHRIAGNDPVETAVSLARYRDQATGFGWGLKAAPANFTLVNVNDWGNAVGAFQLAGSGPRGALLLTDNPDHLPEPVVSYLKGIQGTKPSQGYVMGDRASISPGELAELDALLGAK